MHSLLATLIELRIILLTVFLSGAVHYAIFGGGWLLDAEPASMGGQSIAITVAAPRTVLQPPVEKPPVTEKKAETESQRKEPEKPPVGSKPVVTSSAVSHKESPAANEPGKSQSKPQTPDVARIADLPPEQPVSVTEPDQVVEQITQPARPVFQQQPQFLQPPRPPVYPRIARKRGIEGEVMLRIELDRKGEIITMVVEHSSGSGLLDRAAVAAVERWQFAPAYNDGIAVASYVRIPVNFVLE